MSETDRQLKDKLNTNQSARERMCLEILELQPRFGEVRPRLPKGGPDGGRDIEALYDGKERVVGAVGFVNDASDTDEHRKSAKAKFKSDLKRTNEIKIAKQERTPKVFVFFTNVGLTPNIIDEMKKSAYAAGMIACEVFDRERIRITLDRSDGYGIRFRYLDISLSDAEQKEFFSNWGDQIQGLMTSKLGSIDSASKRLIFLAESQLPVDHLSVGVKLDAPVGTISGGAFVFQTSAILQTHIDGLMHMSFGSASKPIVETLEEIRSTKRQFPKNGQIGFSYASIFPDSGQHETCKEVYGLGEGDDIERWFQIYSSSGILEIEKSYLRAQYCSEPFLMRFHPTCRLIDLHRAAFLFDCNAEIADHVEEITVAANQYHILRLNRSQIKIVDGQFDRIRLPKNAHQDKNSHQWKILRPTGLSSAFVSDFMSGTPPRWMPIDRGEGIP